MNGRYEWSLLCHLPPMHELIRPPRAAAWLVMPSRIESMASFSDKAIAVSPNNASNALSA
jgi:hypothetical protein